MNGPFYSFTNMRTFEENEGTYVMSTGISLSVLDSLMSGINIINSTTSAGSDYDLIRDTDINDIIYNQIGDVSEDIETVSVTDEQEYSSREIASMLSEQTGDNVTVSDEHKASTFSFMTEADIDKILGL